MIIRYSLLCLTLIGFLIRPVGVRAADAIQMPDLNGRELSLTVTMSYKNEEDTVIPLPGVTFEIFRAAELVQDVSGYPEYRLLEDFRESGISFEGMTASASLKAAEELNEIVKKKNLTGISDTTDANGVAAFRELKAGIYLARQKSSSLTGYDELLPFLAMVPLPQEGPEPWIYQVQIFPKTEVKPQTTPTPTPTPGATVTPPPGNPGNPGTPGGGTGIRTGDDTDIFLYLALMAISFTLIFSVQWSKMHREKEAKESNTDYADK